MDSTINPSPLLIDSFCFSFFLLFFLLPGQHNIQLENERGELPIQRLAKRHILSSPRLIGILFLTGEREYYGRCGRKRFIYRFVIIYVVIIVEEAIRTKERELDLD